VTSQGSICRDLCVVNASIIESTFPSRHLDRSPFLMDGIKCFRSNMIERCNDNRDVNGNDHAHKHNSTVYIIYPFYLSITITNDFPIVCFYDYELGIAVKPVPLINMYYRGTHVTLS